MKKINVTRARKLYNDGVTVLLIPRKTRIDNAWGIGCHLNKHDLKERTIEKTFDQLCAEFRYYNCNPETGTTLAYYIGDAITI